MHKECLWGRRLASSCTPAPRCFSLWCNESLGCEISCVRSSAGARSLASFLKDPLYSLYTVYVKWESEVRGQSVLWMPQTPPLKRLVFVSEKRARGFNSIAENQQWIRDEKQYLCTHQTVPLFQKVTRQLIYSTVRNLMQPHFRPLEKQRRKESSTDTHRGHHSTSTDITFTQNSLCYHGDLLRLHWK